MVDGRIGRSERLPITDLDIAASDGAGALPITDLDIAASDGAGADEGLTPYEQGEQAFCNDELRTTNPHIKKTPAHRQWDNGWLAKKRQIRREM